MSNRFCESCGTPLLGDDAFCPTCGAPVGSDDQPQSTASQFFVQMPAQTAPMQPKAKKNNKGPLIGICIAAGVVIILVIAIVFLLASGSESESSKTSTSTSKSASSTNSSSDSSSATGELASAIEIYDQMGTLDGSISTCATNFNENCLKSSMSLREGYAQEAKNVLNEAMTIQSRVSALETKDSNLSSGDKSHLRELAQDLYNRINVICEAWSRSVSYSNPDAHKDYIMAPIVADSDGTSNKYFKHFKENYPNWKPSAS